MQITSIDWEASDEELVKQINALPAEQRKKLDTQIVDKFIAIQKRRLPFGKKVNYYVHSIHARAWGIALPYLMFADAIGGIITFHAIDRCYQMGLRKHSLAMKFHQDWRLSMEDKLHDNINRQLEDIARQFLGEL